MQHYFVSHKYFVNLIKICTLYYIASRVLCYDKIILFNYKLIYSHNETFFYRFCRGLNFWMSPYIFNFVFRTTLYTFITHSLLWQIVNNWNLLLISEQKVFHKIFQTQVLKTILCWHLIKARYFNLMLVIETLILF